MSEGERLILIVEPDANPRQALEEALTDGGDRVIVRESADEAIEVLCSEPIDLVIASTILGDGDGFRLCGAMREQADFDAIPLLFTSDDHSKSKRLEGLQCGAADYLSRPFFFRELQFRIESLLDREFRLVSESSWDVEEGDLADRSVVDLLGEVEDQQLTGTLNIARDGRQAVVHFECGEIVGAVSGTLKGKEALLGLVAWPSGEYVFRTVGDELDIEHDPKNLVLVSIEPLEPWNKLADRLPELKRVLEPTEEEPPDVQGFDDADVESIYALFDGDRSVGEIISESPTDLVVTLRIFDELVRLDCLQDADDAADITGPGIGEPKPGLAKWIDRVGWSAAVVEESNDDSGLVIIPKSAREEEESSEEDSEGEEPAETPQSAVRTEAEEWEVALADTIDESDDAERSDESTEDAAPEDEPPDDEPDPLEETEDDDRDGYGPQPFAEHDAGTIEHVELKITGDRHGASGISYTEKDEQPPSERIEPENPAPTKPEIEVDEQLAGPSGDGFPPPPGNKLGEQGPASDKDETEAEGEDDEEEDGGDPPAGEDVEKKPRSAAPTGAGPRKKKSSGDGASWPAIAIMLLVIGAAGAFVFTSGGDSSDASEADSADERETETEQVVANRDEQPSPSPEDRVVPRDEQPSIGTPNEDPAKQNAAEKKAVENSKDSGRQLARRVESQATDIPEKVALANDTEPSAGGTQNSPPPNDDESPDPSASEKSTEATSQDPETSTDDASPEEPEEKAQTSKQTDEAESDEKPAPKSKDDDDSSGGAGGAQIHSQIAGLINSGKFSAAERKLGNVPSGSLPEERVSDLYLDLAAGYQTEANNVGAAQRVYERYLQIYPDGKYASEVRSILARLKNE